MQRDAGAPMTDDCPECDGTGEVWIPFWAGDMTHEERRWCEECEGHGRVQL